MGKVVKKTGGFFILSSGFWLLTTLVITMGDDIFMFCYSLKTYSLFT